MVRFTVDIDFEDEQSTPLGEQFTRELQDYIEESLIRDFGRGTWGGYEGPFIESVTVRQGKARDFDPVENPKHYNSHPSGVECIEITRHHDFAIGNVIKYVWRAGLKEGNKAKELEDLKKARYYLDDKIKTLETLDRIETVDGSATPKTRFLEFHEVKRGMRVTVAPKRGAGNSVTGIVEYAGAVYIQLQSEATDWTTGMTKETIDTITTTEEAE